MIENFKRNMGIHFFYFVFILLLIVIFISTEKWSEKNNFTEYLGNAATFTSLVLALVAIFYSFIANDSIGKSLGGLGESSSKLNLISDKLESSIDSIEDSKKYSEDIRNKISDLIVDLDIKTSNLNISIDDIKKFGHSLNGSIDQGFEKITQSLGVYETKDTGFAAEKLTKDSALMFLFALYIISYCSENRKLIYPHNIFKKEYESYYLHGIVNALRYSGLINLSIIKKGTVDIKKWIIFIDNAKFMHQEVKDLLIEKINESKSQEEWRKMLDELDEKIKTFEEKN